MAKIKKKNNKKAEMAPEPDLEVKTVTQGVQAQEKLVKQDIRDINQLTQVDGKIYNKYGVKSVDELLGETHNKYSTNDIKDYEAQLNRMNTSDLQKHATSVQVLPKEDRRLLIKLLLKQFQVNHSSQSNLVDQIPLKQDKISQEILDILAEGR